MYFKTRETWKNYSETQISQPLRQYQPESVEDLVSIIQEAETHNLQVRAIGSGHSWSDVGVTPDFLILPEKLNKVLDLDTSLLNDGVDTSTLVHAESGIRIRDLNEELDKRGLALPNMGAYDGQTIVGVIATATHGSGVEFGPFENIVESLELVGEGGIVYRIEPDNGVTNPAAFKRKYPDRKLIQDDDWFHAVVMSMGCMGVFYSVMLRVQEKFWLKEVRTLHPWSEIKEALKQGDVLKDNRHYELYLSPYKKDGDYPCLVTKRNVTGEPKDLPHDKKNRNFFSEFLASIPFIRKVLNFVFNIEPEITPEIIHSSLEGLVDDGYTNVSYKVFHIGMPSQITAISQEIGFPMRDHVYIDAIDKLLEMVEENEVLGELYHTASITVRFVKASDAFLSMMYGYDTCMVEIIMIKDTQGAFEMMHRYENELYKFSGRPHWGQVNSLTFDLIQALYPKFDKWLEIYEKLNKKGTFFSPFTKRIGFSKPPVTAVKTGIRKATTETAPTPAA